MIAPPAIPSGYTPFIESGVFVMALASCADAVRRAVAGGTLYTYASSHPTRRALRGRGAAYAVPLPDGVTRVVVRHSRHGGLLAPITGDRFLFPTRAPHELTTSLRLADAGVRTPEVVAYATYPAGGLLVRSDVATREVVGGVDLADVLAASEASRDRGGVLDAVARLLRSLVKAGARHPDLNVANVLLVPDEDGGRRAYVLDVDRIIFGEPGDPDIAEANVQRLVRSARKLRSRGTIAVSDAELASLAETAGVAA